MHQKKILVSLAALIVLFSTPGFQFTQLAFAEVKVSKPVAYMIEGERILAIGVNTQAILQVDMKNQNDASQPFVLITEVRDSNDVTTYLQFQQGVLAPNSASQIGISWTPELKGSYQARSFAITSFANPIILSAVTSSIIKVGPITELDPGSIQADEPEPPQTIDHPEKEPALYDLQKFALDRINEDRVKFGLSPVELSSNIAAQVHADDVLKTGTISHWMSNGEKPYMTYTRYGGLGAVSQNVAMSGDYYYYKDCTSGRYTCDKIDPFNEIDSHEKGMIYDDKDCCNDGHRVNILDPHHTHVSIGIAFDEYGFVIVQNFENNYVEFDEPVSKDNKHITLSGDLLAADEEYGIYIYYDQNPTPDVYDENKDNGWYSLGEIVAGVTRANYQYDDITTIIANRWSIAGTAINIEFNLEPVMNQQGVYTVELVLEDKDGEPYPVTNYSVFS